MVLNHQCHQSASMCHLGMHHHMASIRNNHQLMNTHKLKLFLILEQLIMSHNQILLCLQDHNH